MKSLFYVSTCLLMNCFFACETKNSDQLTDSTHVADSNTAAVAPDSISTVSKSDSTVEQLTSCPMDEVHAPLLNKLQDTTLRNQLSCFEFASIPFVPEIKSEDSGAKEITSREFLKKYFATKDESMNQEENSFNPNRFFVGYVFDLPNSIGVLVNRQYYPGAFGINNAFAELFIFDYSGKKISQRTLGCQCYDSNMGANEYYSTDDSIVVNKESAIVYSKKTHDQLMESSEGEELPTVEFSMKRDTTVLTYLPK